MLGHQDPPSDIAYVAQGGVKPCQANAIRRTKDGGGSDPDHGSSNPDPGGRAAQPRLAIRCQSHIHQART